MTSRNLLHSGEEGNPQSWEAFVLMGERVGFTRGQALREEGKGSGAGRDRHETARP